MHHRDTQRAAGLTLVELMIVIAVIAVIAAMMVPGFMQSRNAADRSAVIGTIRAIVSAQSQFQSMGVVDVDGDGGNEFGTIREMTGGRALRGDNKSFITRKLLSMSLDAVDAQGRLMKHGHYFALYLPGTGGSGLAETTTNLANIDARLAASYWTLVAWPVRKGQTGNATYFANQQGDVLRSTDAPYSGTATLPPAGCALLGTGDAKRIDTNRIAVGTTGADGYNWTIVQ